MQPLIWGRGKRKGEILLLNWRSLKRIGGVRPEEFPLRAGTGGSEEKENPDLKEINPL